MAIIQPRGKFGGAEVLDANRKHLEPDEAVRLFEHLERTPFWFGYFRLQYYYGSRVSEVAVTLKEDVDWKGKQIIIRRLKRRAPDTGFAENVYGMSDKLVWALRGVASFVPKENPWLFGAKTKAPPAPKTLPDNPWTKNQRRLVDLRTQDGGWRAVSRSAADVAFRRAALAVGIPVALAHTHVLRHTRATLLLAKGVSVEEVQFLLGHTDVKMTRRYLGWAKNLRERVDSHLTALDE